MTLTAGGVLLLGQTVAKTDEYLRVSGAGQASMLLDNTGKTNGAFVGIFNDAGLFGVNRNPATGVFYNTSNYAAEVVAVGSSSTSYISFGTAAAANTIPTERARIDAAGNLGLGVTPSAWLTGSQAFQNGGGSVFQYDNARIFIGQNTYIDSAAADRFIGNGYATRYRQFQGEHAFFVSTVSNSSGAGAPQSLTQAMTLDASGNLLVGTTSTYSSSKMSLGFTGSSNNGFTINNINSSGTPAHLIFQLSGTGVGSITCSGSVTSYNITSDQRLKENIQDAGSASALIDSLQVRQYDWKSDGVHQRYGFIAQELVTVAPEAVHQPADPEETMAVDYSKLVPMLVKEIQDLRKRLAAAGI
jgi:hypothetical protein